MADRAEPGARHWRNINPFPAARRPVAGRPAPPAAVLEGLEPRVLLAADLAGDTFATAENLGTLSPGTRNIGETIAGSIVGPSGFLFPDHADFYRFTLARISDV